MHLARFPRIFAAHLPTPLERLDRLSRELGGPEIWIKRDDCTGLSTGGNKTRKLEFLMAEAEQAAADTVVTMGAIQSNHARQTAAFAAKLGLSCHLVLTNPNASTDGNYVGNGNALLDRLHGATSEHVPEGVHPMAALDAAAERLRAEGRSVYVTPVGGSTAVGALGYANCAMELLSQANATGTRIDRLIHATGSAGTQAGLVAGFHAMSANLPVLGVSVSTPKPEQEAKVLKLVEETANLLGSGSAVRQSDVSVDASYIGEAYGVPTPGGQEAIKMFAELEGVLLDPVYTGKAAACMIDQIRRGAISKDERIVFLHTGGSAALFAYDQAFASNA